LLPDSEITEGIHQSYHYSEYCRGHLETVVKGKLLRADDRSLERRILEMRINIERQFLRVGSFPNYDSVVQIDERHRKKIKPAIPYRFYL